MDSIPCPNNCSRSDLNAFESQHTIGMVFIAGLRREKIYICFRR